MNDSRAWLEPQVSITPTSQSAVIDVTLRLRADAVVSYDRGNAVYSVQIEVEFREFIFSGTRPPF
jgi:hypothetical protein